MQISSTSSASYAQEQLLNVVLIHDIECYVAITHKYDLPKMGVFKDEYGNFFASVRQCELLDKALADYLEREGDFKLPLSGFIEHRERCLEEMAYIQNSFDSNKTGEQL